MNFRIFKAGDKVKCISGANGLGLIQGEILTVKCYNDEGFLELVELPDSQNGWFEDRFVLVEDESIAHLRDLLDRYQEALIWCSAASDFAPEGVARVGWESLCRPLIDQYIKENLGDRESSCTGNVDKTKITVLNDYLGSP